MPSNRPLIGITCEVLAGKRGPRRPALHLDSRYTEAIRQAGGDPILLPLPPEGGAARVAAARRYLGLVRGLLIPGGADLHPRHYGERIKKGTKVAVDERYAFERELYRGAKNRRLPVMGICYGMQMINVIEGGSLHQDLRRDAGAKLEHRSLNRKHPEHEVRIDQDSRLWRILGSSRALVHSSHHQGVNLPARGFRVVARAPDGIVEAIEGPSARILAVQWHPERTPASAASRRLFRHFVRLCAA